MEARSVKRIVGIESARRCLVAKKKVRVVAQVWMVGSFYRRLKMGRENLTCILGSKILLLLRARKILDDPRLLSSLIE